MVFTWRAIAIGSCAGAVVAAYRCRDDHLLAKGTPQGTAVQNVLVKGYGCHPRTVKVLTVLLYYDIPFQVKEYNSLTNDNVYNNIPVVKFEKQEFDWWQSRGDDETMQQLALVCLNRSMTKPEQEWHQFIMNMLTPALEYQMWRTWKSTLEHMRYYTNVKTTSWFRRLVHPYTAAVVLPFRKNRQLRKVHNVNKSSFAAHLKEVLQRMEDMKAPFIGGKRPGITDLELFGVLSAVRNTTLEHEMLQLSSKKFTDWYMNMKEEVYATNHAAWESKTYFALKEIEGMGWFRF